MNRIVLICSVLVFYVCFFACKDNKDPESLEILANQTNVNFDENRGTQTIGVLSNTKWAATVTSGETWLTCTFSPGKNNGSVTMIAEENLNPPARTATLTITTEGGGITRQVTVSQLGTGPDILLAPASTMAVSPEGEDVTVTVTVTDPWTWMIQIPDDRTWVTQKSKSDEDVVFTVEANVTGEERSAEIIFIVNDTDKQATFTITQAPVSVPEVTAPADGVIGGDITLTGTNLLLISQVWFGSLQGAIVAGATDQSMNVTIPATADAGKVDLKVIYGANRELIAGQIILFKGSPTIVSLSKNKGVFGEEITIIGFGFGATKDDNEVFFRKVGSDDVVKAEITEASSNSLKIIAPYFYVRDIEIYVINKNNEELSNIVGFNFDLFSCDSITIVTADWAIESLRADAVWKKATFRAFGSDSRRDVNVIEITPGAGGVNTHLGVAVKSDGGTQVTSAFGAELNALAVINGSYFIMSQEEIDAFSPPPYSLHHIRIDNTVIVPGVSTAPGLDSFVDACMAFSKMPSGNYEMSFIRVSGANRNIVQSNNFGAGTNPLRAAGGYDYAMTAGPWLILNGERRLEFNTTSSHWITSRPRTGIGIDTDGKVFLVTVDGDSATAGSVGITIEQQATIMKALGCIGAMSLDGGGSTTMWIQNKGVVSDVFGSSTQRAIANVIYVK